jgi:hypothetical protein
MRRGNLLSVNIYVLALVASCIVGTGYRIIQKISYGHSSLILVKIDCLEQLDYCRENPDLMPGIVNPGEKNSIAGKKNSFCREA